MAEEQKFKCSDCGKVFDTKERMLQHKNDAHKSATHEGSKKPFNARKLLPYVIGIIILAAIAGVAYWIINATVNGPGSIGNFNLSFVPYQGNVSAKLNIVEFGDYQCPVCAAFQSGTEPQVIKSYANTGKAKFYFMDFAFLSPDSTTLAEGAWCADEQGLYYQYHDFVYSIQGPEGSGWGSPSKMKAFVTNITGLNVQQFNSCVDSGKYASRVSFESQLAQSSGATGTPTFFIGNQQLGYATLVGDLSFSDFSKAVDAQIAKTA